MVINDGIVLIDFINRGVREGSTLRSALLEAGRRRFRPVLLTSVTTVAGLLPILSEKSFQAQILIPMAASLCFGLMLATVLVLILIPVFYHVYARFQQIVFLPLMNMEVSVTTAVERSETPDVLPLTEMSSPEENERMASGVK